MQKVAFEGLVRVFRFDWWLMSAIPRFVSSGLEASLSESGARYAGTYLYSQGGKEGREGKSERLKEGRKKRRDAVCLRDCPNKKILPEFFLCHLLLEGISEHVWDGLCAVCFALCAGMQRQPQVNRVMLRYFPIGYCSNHICIVPTKLIRCV